MEEVGGEQRVKPLETAAPHVQSPHESPRDRGRARGARDDALLIDATVREPRR